MTTRIEQWVNEHPIFVRMYMPTVVTMTLVVVLANALKGRPC